MSKAPDGGLAFPFNAGEHGIEPSPGMTLRDWFAGRALDGLMCGLMDESDEFSAESAREFNERAIRRVTSGAYRYADAMLAERAKGGA